MTAGAKICGLSTPEAVDAALKLALTVGATFAIVAVVDAGALLAPFASVTVSGVRSRARCSGMRMRSTTAARSWMRVARCSCPVPSPVPARSAGARSSPRCAITTRSTARWG